MIEAYQAGSVTGVQKEKLGLEVPWDHQVHLEIKGYQGLLA